MTITADGIEKSFNGFPALRGVNLTASRGEFVALLGPSGSGKTTLLRILAGLEFADGGRLLFDGQDVAAQGAGERNVGFVFQHYALFKHMTVAENVSFGLRVKPRDKRLAKAQIDAHVNELLRLVQLERLGGRYPSQLSGGQRQRVALARALAIQPGVLLLDEPFGALDAKVRKELRRWLRRLHDEMHVTSVFVTHDQEEAMEVADRVVVMNHGRIEQEGSPDQVYDHPATPFVLQFLGDVNLFHGRLDHAAGSEVSYVRPHELDIVAAPEPGTWPVTLSQTLTVGPNTRLEFERQDDGSHVDVELSRETWIELRTRLGLKPGTSAHLKPRRVTRFGTDAKTPPP
jgi:sulfate transport system ATP-binding protein